MLHVHGNEPRGLAFSTAVRCTREAKGGGPFGDGLSSKSSKKTTESRKRSVLGGGVEPEFYFTRLTLGDILRCLGFLPKAMLRTEIEGGACEDERGEKMQAGQAHLTAAGDQLLEQLHPRIDLLASRLMSGHFFNNNNDRKDNQLFDETVRAKNGSE